MTRASSFQRAPDAGKGRCGRSVGILRTALPQPHPRPGALCICLTPCRLFLGRVSRQALLAKSGRLGEHIAMAAPLVRYSLVALPLALKRESGASCRNLGSSLVVIIHFRNLMPGRSPLINSTPARSKACGTASKSGRLERQEPHLEIRHQRRGHDGGSGQISCDKAMKARAARHWAGVTCAARP